jgi:hypothetical protein
MSLICPYDETKLDPAILSNGRMTHRRCLERGHSTPNPDFGDPLDFLL